MDNTHSTEPNETTNGADATELYFGQAQFPKQSIRGVRFTNRLEGNIGIRSASVNVAPPTALRWNYRAESKLYGRGNLWLTGICISASQGNEGEMKIELRGPFWLLDRAGLQSLETFSMSNRENRYWLVRLCNGQMAAPPEVASDTELRAFIYAVPLKGMTASRGKSLVMGDSGIASHEYDTTFAPLLKQLESTKSNNVWDDDNPKVWGVVVAHDMMEAERVALARAQYTADLVNFALRAGVSHFETRYEVEILSWDAEVGMTPISLHPWIFLREVKTGKGWVRELTRSRPEPATDLDNCMQRIQFFADRFLDAHQAENVHTQVGPTGFKQERTEAF